MSLCPEVLTSEQKFQRRIFVVRIACQQGVQAAALRSGIPDRTIRDWKAKFEKFGIEGLREKSRKPKNSPGRKDEKGVLSFALIGLHKNEPGLTREQVLAKLFGEPSQDDPTLSWIDRTRRRLGLTRKRKERKKEHKLRYERPVPGYLQIDTKEVEKDGEPGQKLYQFTAIDECTRVRFLGGSLSKSKKAASLFLEQAIEFFAGLGVKVIQAQTDNGTEYALPHIECVQESYARGDTEEALFTQTCQKYGIRHRQIKPRTPELNGKVERSHKTDEERFYSRYRFANEFDLDHALKNVWMPEYNELRPHRALNGMAPMDFLKKKLKELAEAESKQKIQNLDATADEKIAA
jgi:transposase InsO family protein